MAPETESDWPHLFEQGARMPGDTSPVLLALHGTGSHESEIIGLARQVDAEAGILAPRGRVNENGSGRWFRRLAEGVFDVDDVVQRADELARFITLARVEYALDDRPFVAVGFSNGANMGLAMVTLHPELVSRAIAFSGMYPLGDREIPGDLSDSSVLLLNGDADPMAPSSSVDRLADQLLAHGAAVERITRPGGHGITESELAAAQRWL